ncbi:MAG TPA: metallophosphoesterase [Methylovirgula sp.]|nr:metallophosphoesterase [Methylovirgula sp.]
MALLTRRHFLQSSGGLFLATAGVGTYALAIEPGFRLDVTSYRLTPPGWTEGLKLKCAVIADIHACRPLMPATRVRAIADLTNRLDPDIIFLLGDFNAGHRFVTAPVYPEEWGEALSILKAPLGVYSVLGNHDWWHGPLPGMRSDGAEKIRRALRHAEIAVLENDAVRLSHEGQTFWVAGLADQLAHRTGRWDFKGIDDLSGTLSKVTDDSPVLLLAHEPFVFRRAPERVSLTLCGHTHGGQVNLPVLTAAYARNEFGSDHIYGHIVEDGRHMIISAGLGTSIAPVRFLRPPELVQITLGSEILPA